jgi:hypothetical protein
MIVRYACRSVVGCRGTLGRAAGGRLLGARHHRSSSSRACLPDRKTATAGILPAAGMRRFWVTPGSTRVPALASGTASILWANPMPLSVGPCSGRESVGEDFPALRNDRRLEHRRDRGPRRRERLPRLGGPAGRDHRQRPSRPAALRQPGRAQPAPQRDPHHTVRRGDEDAARPILDLRRGQRDAVGHLRLCRDQSRPGRDLRRGAVAGLHRW